MIDSLFGIRLPLIQAPMAGVQDSELAIAVASAGGLGSLPCAMLSPDKVLQEANHIRACTAAPFNLNFFCHTMPPFDADLDSRWQSLFAKYYQAFGLEPSSPSSAGVRMPFDQVMADVVTEIRPSVVSFHFGLPNEVLMRQVLNAGCKVISSATTVEEAEWLAARGVHAIIAQGVEAGGHRGMFLTEDLQTQEGTLALVRDVVKAVRLPVIAAGGIADATAVKTAFAAGAAGVQVGTAYLLCPEARTSRVHRAALQSIPPLDTTITNLFSGRPARGMVNRMVNELGAIHPLAPAFPYASLASSPLRTHAEKLGLSDFTPLWAGQNFPQCLSVPAAQVTKDLCSAL